LADLVVAESVSVIKRLLQIRGNENTQSVIRLAKLLDKTTVPVARANIFWLVGQYAENISTAAPDILRKAVKGFTDEVCEDGKWRFVKTFITLIIGYLPA
jgi:AP-3 complex subunit beta